MKVNLEFEAHKVLEWISVQELNKDALNTRFEMSLHASGEVCMLFCFSFAIFHTKLKFLHWPNFVLILIEISRSGLVLKKLSVIIDVMWPLASCSFVSTTGIERTRPNHPAFVSVRLSSLHQWHHKTNSLFTNTCGIQELSAKVAPLTLKATQTHAFTQYRPEMNVCMFFCSLWYCSCSVLYFIISNNDI